VTVVFCSGPENYFAKFGEFLSKSTGIKCRNYTF
jgi:hypothetical protein